jgi:hypothetical protein
MAKKYDAKELLFQGYLPSEIAKIQGVSALTIVQYLRLLVGEGRLSFTEIYFSWPEEKRKKLDEALQKESESSLPNYYFFDLGVDMYDFELYKTVRNLGAQSGDLYKSISSIEIKLHDLVKDILSNEFGADESCFWRQGIPQNIRIRCHERREMDDDFSESPFNYTTLIDLANIITKNWNIFLCHLPEQYKSKNRLVSDFSRLNQIRNAVMHPVKRRTWTEQDFEFVRQFCLLFEPLC